VERYLQPVIPEHAIDQPPECIGGCRDAALRPAVHQADDARGAVDERCARITRDAVNAGEEGVREVGERWATADPIEARGLEAGARGIALEVEDGADDRAAADER